MESKKCTINVFWGGAGGESKHLTSGFDILIAAVTTMMPESPEISLFLTVSWNSEAVTTETIYPSLGLQHIKRMVIMQTSQK